MLFHSLSFRVSQLLVALLFVISLGSLAHSGDSLRSVPLPQPLGQQGTLAVRFNAAQAYANGPVAAAVTTEIFTIPGVASCRCEQSPTVCALVWEWDPAVGAEPLVVEIPELPGPEAYFLHYSWDAAAGTFTGYANGTPLRLPGVALPPWKMPAVAEIRLAPGTDLVSVQPTSLDAGAARAEVPAEYRGRRAELFGVVAAERPALDISGRLGAVIFESSLALTEDVMGWVMEGPGQIDFASGWMTLQSERPTGGDGNIVFWCPHDFPERFVAEWEVEVLSQQGLCISFFAAAGSQGEDLFAPTLRKRTGVFRQYTQSDIDCYHISYFANAPSAPGRITSNMRKNSGFHVVTNGPPGIAPGQQGAHDVLLIKDGDRMHMQVDGRVVIDFLDDGKRYGPVLGAGKIGFRQMSPTVARYRRFRVQALAPPQ
jgi:hypothetical protein